MNKPTISYELRDALNVVYNCYDKINYAFIVDEQEENAFFICNALIHFSFTEATYRIRSGNDHIIAETFKCNERLLQEFTYLYKFIPQELKGNDCYVGDIENNAAWFNNSEDTIIESMKLRMKLLSYFIFDCTYKE